MKWSSFITNTLLLTSSNLPPPADLDLVNHVNSGGNAIIVSSANGTHTDLSYFLSQLGIYVTPKGYEYVDYQLERANQSSHLQVALINNNPLIYPFEQTPETSFTVNTNDGQYWHIGSQGYSIVKFQAKNNARVTWIGDESLLNDDLVQWTDQQIGVIRATQLSVENLTPSDLGFKVGDEIEVSINFEELVNGNWIPFTPTVGNVQLELTMLDPYYRLNLEEIDNGIFKRKFNLPDQHGVFELKVKYNEPGFTWVEETRVITVRHLANDEFKRSWEIENAWVYIASWAVCVLGWLLFVIGWISQRLANTPHQKKD